MLLNILTEPGVGVDDGAGLEWEIEKVEMLFGVVSFCIDGIVTLRNMNEKSSNGESV